MKLSTDNPACLMMARTVPGGRSWAPWTGTIILDAVKSGLFITWWLSLMRSILNPVRYKALMTALPLTPVNRRATSGRYADRAGRRYDIGGNFVTIVAPNLQRQFDGFVRHTDSLVLIRAVGDDFRKGRHQNSEAAFRLRLQMDRVAYVTARYRRLSTIASST